MSIPLSLGLGLYAVNLLVGVGARWLGAKFGAWHHVLYAAVVTGALVAAVLAFHVALIVVLLALAAIPLVSAKSKWHPAIALVGFVGYLAAALLPHLSRTIP